jgi:hypothetical protein
MQLDGALFEQLAAAMEAGVAAPAEGTAAASKDEPRRREPRVSVSARARATVIPLSDTLAAAPFEVSVQDLSAGGIGFLHTDRIRLDEQFVVLLPGGGDSVAVLCQVAYYQPLPNRLYAVGAEFVRVLRQPAPEPPGTFPLTQPAKVPRRAAS